MRKMENKVLIINTGGTIGMVGKPLRPAYNWAEITKGYSVLENFQQIIINLKS